MQVWVNMNALWLEKYLLLYLAVLHVYITIYIEKITMVGTILMLKLIIVPKIANISLSFTDPTFKQQKKSVWSS